MLDNDHNDHNDNDHNEVIAIFQDRRSAGCAIENLVLAGFEHGSIDVRMSEKAQEPPPSRDRPPTDPASSPSELGERLALDLRSHGVAENSAQRSAQEIERGGVLVIVDVGDDVDHDRQSVVYEILRCAGGDPLHTGGGASSPKSATAAHPPTSESARRAAH